VNRRDDFSQEDPMDSGLQETSLTVPQNARGMYSDSRFFSTLRRAVQAVGALVLQPALELYFIMKAPETPLWAKASAIGALGYLILPLDLIPDSLPGIGWTDDVAVMTAALRTLSNHNTPAIQAQAKAVAEKLMASAARRRA
jgi:uncharacterized membrane protein YkvA (DUF1232 family)